MRKVAFIAALAAFAPLLPAHAVVLEQKWQAGQNLSYQTQLQGTANLQAPANAPFLFAGVPLEVEVSGVGLTQLKTLTVDDSGVGTVVVSIPQFDLSAKSLGQQGRFILQNEKSRALLNGRAIKLGDGTNPLSQPTMAIRISPQGRVMGTKELKPAAAPQPTAAEDDNPVAPAQAINKSALLAATIVSSLPTLWPGRDVQIGETWTANMSVPVPSATEPKTTVPTQLGTWDLTFKGTETVAGKELQRVGVVGQIVVDSSQFETPEQKKIDMMRGKASQNVSGDLWLDNTVGQIVRADLVLGARAEGGQAKIGQTWADFTGTLQLNLKDAA